MRFLRGTLLLPSLFAAVFFDLSIVAHDASRLHGLEIHAVVHI